MPSCEMALSTSTHLHCRAQLSHPGAAVSPRPLSRYWDIAINAKEFETGKIHIQINDAASWGDGKIGFYDIDLSYVNLSPGHEIP